MLIKKINIKHWFVYISVKFKGILFERIELISNYSRVFTDKDFCFTIFLELFVSSIIVKTKLVFAD
jgi:hypothetical protein